MPRRIKRLSVLFICVILIVFSVGGCGKNKESVNGGADGLFTIRMVTPISTNEIMVGKALGFFAEQGIKIEFIGAAGKGVTEFQLIEQGLADIASGHPAHVAQAILAGVEVKAVAPCIVDNQDFPHVRYLTQEDSSVKTLEDIIGKKVAVRTISICHDGYLRYYLKTHGLDPEKVEFISFPNPGEMEHAVPQGYVDLCTAHPPYAGIVLGEGGVREVATSWDIFGNPGAGLSMYSFGEDFIAKHPAVIQGFVNAAYKSRLWINEHQEEALNIIAKEIGVEPSGLTTFWFDENKNIDPDYLTQWFEIAEEIELWKHGDVVPEELYTNAFIPEDPIYEQ
ncbi:MAG: ABC transporter substrate-binding protein [Peptococcaceae bacterium]|jgi:ABC-type nitrate/sulfonate/bicarbonate transport system substrate-binding protein|nr:ABC transporter substrate-binding protein [Peptococcaceae bacterium]